MGEIRKISMSVTAYEAAKHGDFSTMVALLQETPGQVRQVQPASGYTILHQAAWHGNQMACSFILGLGGTEMLTARNAKGETPIDVCHRKGHAVCASVLHAATLRPLPAPTAASLPTDAPILVVADVHGHLAKLIAALRSGAEFGATTAVLIGDFCDNGHEIAPLLDYLCDIRDNGGLFQGMQVRPILGNHDLACLLAAKPGVFHTPLDPAFSARWWQRWHGFWNYRSSTPEGYGLPASCSLDQFRDAFPRRHLDFLEDLPWFHQEDGYIFVHAGLATGVPVETQLTFLEAKDLSQPRLSNSGFETYKGMSLGYGMPDQLTHKGWAETNDPAWGQIVVTGHNKYATHSNVVLSNRLGLHSGVCEGGPLHCALLRRGAIDLSKPEGAPLAQFNV